MAEWEITDQEIELTEKLLLPENAHFPEDARTVIHCWHSTDVSACPGSGKTTVLLAKLKILADRMPLENGAGICVLSHTNVAVDEIRKRLSGYTDKLMSYPNYFGTIQSFIDKFVTMPYLRDIAGRNVQVIDDQTYARYMLTRMYRDNKFKALRYVIDNNYKSSTQFSNKIQHIKEVYLRDDGSLCIGNQKKALAGAGKVSAQQFSILINDLLRFDGVITFRDAYSYANKAIDDLSSSYKDLFPMRFQYVFIDEYQDCDSIQRQALNLIFNSEKCSVMRIGDSDQAIYNSSETKISDWVPQKSHLPILTSYRYSQEIATIISKLKAGDKNIETFSGSTGIKPVLLVFDPKHIYRVLDAFISELEKHGIHDRQGIYKAIGAVRKDTGTGLTIGSYWAEFDASPKKQRGHNYWMLIDEINMHLSNGDLYKAEHAVRMLLCSLFHFANIVQATTGKEYTVHTIRKVLDSECRDIYRHYIYELSILPMPDRENIDSILRTMVNEILQKINPSIEDMFVCVPRFFLEKAEHSAREEYSHEKNVFIEPLRGRRIVFDTIHGVKGETHDATLYLETDRMRSSDLCRILPYFGKGKIGTSDLFNYSRKLAYVGMSRPRKLLCVAMQSKTFERSGGTFLDDWEIIDLR